MEASQLLKSDPHARSAHRVAPEGRAEFGEIDASEDSIDGMGVINFADEEDCGFFGMLLSEYASPGRG